MPTYLEVWEIFLDPEIQVAQIVGWKNGDAKSSEVAVTGDCFAEFSLRSKIAASQVQNPLNAHSPSFFFFFIFLLSLQEPHGSATCSWNPLERPTCCWRVNPLDVFGGQ